MNTNSRLTHLHKFTTFQMGSNTNTNANRNSSCYMAWSPCSRLFLVATTSPKMNVDNGLVIYKYNGEMVGEWRLEGMRSEITPAMAREQGIEPTKGGDALYGVEWVECGSLSEQQPAERAQSPVRKEPRERPPSLTLAMMGESS